MNGEGSAVVKTTSGSVEGAVVKGTYCFKGIPYAAPIDGERAWLPPQPGEAWSGVRPAKSYGCVCAQMRPKPKSGLGGIISQFL